MYFLQNLPLNLVIHEDLGGHEAPSPFKFHFTMYQFTSVSANGQSFQKDVRIKVKTLCSTILESWHKGKCLQQMGTIGLLGLTKQRPTRLSITRAWQTYASPFIFFAKGTIEFFLYNISHIWNIRAVFFDEYSCVLKKGSDTLRCFG